VEPDDDYPLLFGLGSGLGDRLAATVAAHWAERIERGDVTRGDQPALHAALTGRVWVAARAWLGDAGADVDVRMIEPSEPPSVSRDGDRWTLALPFRWLSRVWAPSLAMTAGRLVIDAERQGDVLTLTTLQPGSERPTKLTLEI